MTKLVALYVRVSTDVQTVDNQIRELTAVAEKSQWKIVKVFRDDGISGAKGRDQRPGLNDLLKAVAKREVDMVMAWSVDRLGRSLNHLLAVLGELHAKSVDLYLHQQGIDTSTPAGRAMFQMLGVFAEFEREMIRERVRSGLARARARGVIGGRPKVSPEIEAAVRERLLEGKTFIKIREELKVSNWVCQRLLNEIRREKAAQA